MVLDEHSEPREGFLKPKPWSPGVGKSDILELSFDPRLSKIIWRPSFLSWVSHSSSNFCLLFLCTSKDELLEHLPVPTGIGISFTLDVSVRAFSQLVPLFSWKVFRTTASCYSSYSLLSVHLRNILLTKLLEILDDDGTIQTEDPSCTVWALQKVRKPPLFFLQVLLVALKALLKVLRGVLVARPRWRSGAPCGGCLAKSFQDRALLKYFWICLVTKTLLRDSKVAFDWRLLSKYDKSSTLKHGTLWKA